MQATVNPNELVPFSRGQNPYPIGFGAVDSITPEPADYWTGIENNEFNYLPVVGNPVAAPATINTATGNLVNINSATSSSIINDALKSTGPDTSNTVNTVNNPNSNVALSITGMDAATGLVNTDRGGVLQTGLLILGGVAAAAALIMLTPAKKKAKKKSRRRHTGRRYAR